MTRMNDNRLTKHTFDKIIKLKKQSTWLTQTLNDLKESNGDITDVRDMEIFRDKVHKVVFREKQSFSIVHQIKRLWAERWMKE